MDITIAVSDLTHADWGKQYFPEDLPSDWQFDYYMNEFDALLSSNETLALEAAPNFLFVLETKQTCPELPITTCELLVVVFPSIKQIEIVSNIEISKAEILSRQNISETVCILRVASDCIVKNEEIKTLLVHIRTNYSQFDRVCLFLSRSMQKIEVINASKIINDLL